MLEKPLLSCFIVIIMNHRQSMKFATFEDASENNFVT